MSELLDLTASEAGERIRTGELDAGELWRAYRDRAAADDLNAYTWVSGELEPPPVEAGSPLGGVPVAVKDLFCTEGIPSQAGSRILEGYRPPYTATAVRRLEGAGAPVLGKTNQDEFAMGSSTEHSAFGPTLNPWDRGRVPGGSSGGSAAAVAAGLAPWAIGTDTGGSIRQPAALCGIVGMKPTYGAVSRYGMIAFASSLDQAGPFTRDVKDAALLLGAMVGQDPCDSTSIGLREPIAVPSAADLEGIRLGVPEELTGEGIEPGVLERFNETLELARELGATVETMRLPHAPHGLAAYYLIAPAEASSNLARYDGVRYGYRAKDYTDLLSMYTRTREEGFGAEVKRRIMLGTYALSSGYYEAYYGRAQKVRTRIAEDFRDAWERFDFVVTPTSPTVAFELGAKLEDPLAMYLNDVCAVPMSLAGIPAISIPNGLSDGLPTGFQIAGPAFSENRILDAAFALEQAIGFDTSGGARMTAWEPVIGLEIHVQLKTRTKMFCSCALSFGEEPNTRTCPVCLGLPGTLPVTNAQAIHFGLMMGLALECELAPRSLFHRKNYFYPDQAKNYQISQYDVPLCLGGRLGDVRLHRIHLEEDAAKLVHLGVSGRIHGSEASIVDYNRGGTPLAEIVTEPDLHSAEDARDWLNLLRVTLRQLGVSDVNMEEGSLRCDANVSVRPAGSDELGTKTELKNMNSFRFLMQGINAEVKRQIALLEAGERVVQETLHFDPTTGRISTLRSKEEAHDYRYFPEPDLVPVAPTEEMLQAARDALPELPAARAERYERDWELPEDAARLLAFEPVWGDYFEIAATAADRGLSRAVANWVTELRGRLGADADPNGSGVSPQDLAGLARLVADRATTPGNARKVLDAMIADGGDPGEIVEREGLGAMEGGDELAGIVAKVIGEHPDVVERIKGGNEKAMGALVGPIMKETRGRADGGEVNRLIREQLGV